MTAFYRTLPPPVSRHRRPSVPTKAHAREPRAPAHRPDAVPGLSLLGSVETEPVGNGPEGRGAFCVPEFTADGGRPRTCGPASARPPTPRVGPRLRFWTDVVGGRSGSLEGLAVEVPPGSEALWPWGGFGSLTADSSSREMEAGRLPPHAFPRRKAVPGGARSHVANDTDTGGRGGRQEVTRGGASVTWHGTDTEGAGAPMAPSRGLRGPSRAVGAGRRQHPARAQDGWQVRQPGRQGPGSDHL